MVNTQLLDELIEGSGKKRSYLADKLGCSLQTFRKKLNGEYEFTNTQADILCSELGITTFAEKRKIFPIK